MAANSERQINIKSGNLIRRIDAQGVARLDYTAEEQDAFSLAAQKKAEWKKTLGRALTDEELDAIERSVPGVWEARLRISDLTDAVGVQTKMKSTKIQ